MGYIGQIFRQHTSNIQYLINVNILHNKLTLSSGKFFRVWVFLSVLPYLLGKYISMYITYIYVYNTYSSSR